MASTLKVNEIQHTGGNTAATISSSGEVTLTVPSSITTPIIFQGFNDTTTYTSNGIWVAVKETIDTANAYNNSTGVFTAPRAGYYHCSFHALYRGAGNLRLNFRKNSIPYGIASGGSASMVYQDAEAGDEENIKMTQIIQCAVSDTIDVHIHAISGGDIYGNSNGHNGLTVFFIG